MKAHLLSLCCFCWLLLSTSLATVTTKQAIVVPCLEPCFVYNSITDDCSNTCIHPFGSAAPPGTSPGTGTRPGTRPGSRPGTRPGIRPGTLPVVLPGARPGIHPGIRPGINRPRPGFRYPPSQGIHNPPPGFRSQRG
ncbi:hypothetical protein OTU49_003170 [Cherax quadricarinatus]|uniref:Uncharacterized protein n=1 Tax=Cherax quadricarinatus TaxID=27406 RepID=A0AAW0XJN0_CHEQU